VAGQKFRLRIRRFRELLLKGARDSAVQLESTRLEQRLVRDVLDQRVLEA
jgi:hypothetical protein